VNKLFLIIILTLISFSVISQNNNTQQFVSGLKFDSTSINFGKVIEGPSVILKYYFTNENKFPVRIGSVTGNVSTANWDREPIGPHKKGLITLTYPTQGRIGTTTKQNYVMFDLVPVVKLSFNGEVIPDSNTDARCSIYSKNGKTDLCLNIDKLDSIKEDIFFEYEVKNNSVNKLIFDLKSYNKLSNYTNRSSFLNLIRTNPQNLILKPNERQTFTIIISVDSIKKYNNDLLSEFYGNRKKSIFKPNLTILDEIRITHKILNKVSANDYIDESIWIKISDAKNNFIFKKTNGFND
jgi:Protein of unknown function (DUF1573)